MDHSYHLTKLASEGGCAAKLPAGKLSSILNHSLQSKTNACEKLLTSHVNNEDAAVYRISDDMALIETVDFFPPVVDDPYVFGQIAASNALSDIYAMGGKPILALNLLTTPCSLDEECISKILEGGLSKVREAGACIGGGHSITDQEPKFGMAVSGIVNPDNFWKNSGARTGDVLILTKPLGFGIYALASRAGMLNESEEDEMVMLMTELNKDAAESAKDLEVHACTDVTGFGLLVHALEMAEASQKCFNIRPALVPMLGRAIELAKNGILPKGVYNNRDRIDCSKILIDDKIEREVIDVLADPQTSGGLLLAMSPGDAELYLDRIKTKGKNAYVIGNVSAFDNVNAILNEE